MLRAALTGCLPTWLGGAKHLALSPTGLSSQDQPLAVLGRIITTPWGVLFGSVNLHGLQGSAAGAPQHPVAQRDSLRTSSPPILLGRAATVERTDHCYRDPVQPLQVFWVRS